MFGELKTCMYVYSHVWETTTKRNPKSQKKFPVLPLEKKNDKHRRRDLAVYQPGKRWIGSGRRSRLNCRGRRTEP